MTTRKRRPRGEGGLVQRHDHKTCPPAELVTQPDGKTKRLRPDHKCKGTWAATIDLGYVGGKRKVVTVYGGTKTEALAKQRKKKNEIAKYGAAAAQTGGTTVAQWLDRWLVEIAHQRYKPKTLATNRYVIRAHIIPAIGNIRLDKLEPPDVVRMERAVEAKTKTVKGKEVPLSTSTSLQCHRVLSKALTDAMRWNLVIRNVCENVDPPRKPASTRGALTAEEARTVLKFTSTSGDRLGSRWFMALTHGVRQGEALGLRWPHVDLEQGILDLAWELQRVPFRHGCGEKADGAWPCGRKRPGSCPGRELDVPRGLEHHVLEGGLTLLRPKSKAGTRMVALLPWAVSVMRERHDLYLTERGSYDRDHELVWPRADGRPIDPRDDSSAWDQLLRDAGVRDVELHAARHTSATLLHEAGVPEHTTMSILGHSSATVTRGYMHVSLDEQRKALGKLGDVLAISPSETE